VPYAHKQLSSGLDLGGYTSELYELVSIQRCSAKGSSSASSGSSGSDSRSSSAGSSSSGSSASSASSSSGGSGAAGVLDRLAGGRDPAYAFVYPNLMINRYGCAGRRECALRCGSKACA
jgi:hypothetical protein